MATPPNWQRVWEIFEGALEQPPGRRAAWVGEVCDGDESLGDQVSRLLEAHEKEGGLLDTTAGSLASEALVEADPASANEQIGPYRVLSEIGRGGMAVVYKAEDPRLGRYVALKFISPHLISSQQAKQRMISEARAASRLDHPNICTIYDIGETHDGRIYLTMAYYEGQTLAERLLKGPVSVAEALAITAQIARALDHAHEAGVIHRDIKPSNVLLTSRGDVKVLDFGLAKQGGLVITEPGTQLGTVYYASPEQASGKQVDARTDLWSLGATLYEMLTGRTPFTGEEAMGVLYQIVHDEPPALGSDVPWPVARVVRKLLAKNPGSRYANARELLVDIGAPVSTGSDPGSVTGIPPAKSRVWQIAFVVLAVALLAVVALPLYIGRTGSQPALETPIPLTSFPGREELATFSPDGSQVAFTWNGPNQDNFDIYVKFLDSPEALRLTEAPGWDSSPVWSPNGKEIAFLRERPGGVMEVRLTTPIGGPERLLTTVRCSVRSGMSWSSGGERILVANHPSADGSPEVVSIHAGTGEKQTLIRAPENTIEVRSPIVSPDGKKVAFDALRGTGLGDTYLFAGDRLKRLTFTGGEPEGLAWTRDGKHILSARLSSDGRRNMWRVPVSGGDAERVALGENPSQPTVSKMGDRLAFSKRVTYYGIVRIDASHPGNSAAASRFISSTRFDATPHFSPDGERIAFSSSRSGDVEIWVCDADGTNLQQLTKIGVAGSPRWSPDGTSIAFDSIVDGNPDVYVVNANGGQPRRITTDEAVDVVPSFSRDGKWIYFASLRTGEFQVWKIASGPAGEPDATPVQVTTGGGFHANESMDGSVLYYSNTRSSENSIWRKPVDGGPEELVIDGVDSGWGNWEVHPDGIYFINTRGPSNPFMDGTWAVYFFRFRDRKVSEVVRLNHLPTRGGEGLGVSPDGRWILIGDIAIESDLMLVENFR